MKGARRRFHDAAAEFIRLKKGVATMKMRFASFLCGLCALARLEIDEELAGDLDVEHVQDARIVGVSGSAPAWVGRLRSLRVGEDQVRQAHVMVGPRTGMLLLGMDVLSALNLTIGPSALERD